MNSGTTLKEIKRLFEMLEENKTNSGVQIIIDTEMCNSLYNLFIDVNKYQKILEERIDKAIEYINNLRDESAEKQGFYNCFPDDLYIANIDELLKILKGEENE